MIKLIDYYADWCGPCRAMESIMEELKKEMKGNVIFEKIDVDKEQDKANTAGVMSLPTFHIIKNEKIVQTLIGYHSKAELKKELEAAMAA